MARLLIPAVALGLVWFECPPNARAGDSNGRVLEGVVFVTTPSRESIPLSSSRIYILREEDVFLNVEDAQTWALTELIPKKTEKAKEMYQDAMRKLTEKREAEEQLEKARQGGGTLESGLRELITKKHEAVARWEIAKGNVDYAQLENGANAFRERLFSVLPQPVAGAMTDAEGKFRLEIPKKGRFAIACKEDRDLSKDYPDLVQKAGVPLNKTYYWYFFLPPEDSEGVIRVQLGMETLFGEGSNQLDVAKMPNLSIRLPTLPED